MTHAERIALEYIVADLQALKPTKSWMEERPEWWEEHDGAIRRLFQVVRSSRPQVGEEVER